MSKDKDVPLPPKSMVSMDVLECWAETIWEELGNESVKVYLTNGINLTGILTQADASGLTIRRDGKGCKVMWHAIATYAHNPLT